MGGSIVYGSWRGGIKEIAETGDVGGRWWEIIDGRRRGGPCGGAGNRVGGRESLRTRYAFHAVAALFACVRLVASRCVGDPIRDGMPTHARRPLSRQEVNRVTQVCAARTSESSFVASLFSLFLLLVGLRQYFQDDDTVVRCRTRCVHLLTAL